MSIWFTSDPHYNHGAIIDHCYRPFKTIKQMNRTLIKNYNAVVGPDDVVYFVGDLALMPPSHIEVLRQFVRQLNGTKHLILGNHDEFKPFAYVEIGFASVHTSLEVEEFMLVHDPASSCVDRNRPYIVGHVHDLFVTQKNAINVGVDVWDFKPIHIDKVREIARSLNYGYETKSGPCTDVRSDKPAGKDSGDTS